MYCVYEMVRKCRASISLAKVMSYVSIMTVFDGIPQETNLSMHVRDSRL